MPVTQATNPAIAPLRKEQAGAEAHEIYDLLTKHNGFMPNFFGLMAHRPSVLKLFVPLYGEIVNKGSVEAKYKELAYLKTATVNSCEY